MNKAPAFQFYASDTLAMFTDPTGRRGSLPMQFAPASPAGPPEQAGIYAVCLRSSCGSHPEHVVYIGSAMNIKKRVMSTNHVYRKLYERANGWLVYTRSFVTDNWQAWEKEAIRVLRPALNKQHKTNG